jgi:hypothetical protein
MFCSSWSSSEQIVTWEFRRQEKNTPIVSKCFCHLIESFTIYCLSTSVFYLFCKQWEYKGGKLLSLTWDRQGFYFDMGKLHPPVEWVNLKSTQNLQKCACFSWHISTWPQQWPSLWLFLPLCDINLFIL